MKTEEQGTGKGRLEEALANDSLCLLGMTVQVNSIGVEEVATLQSKVDQIVPHRSHYVHDVSLLLDH